MTLTLGQNVSLSWVVVYPWVLDKVNSLLHWCYIDPNWVHFDPVIFSSSATLRNKKHQIIIGRLSWNLQIIFLLLQGAIFILMTPWPSPPALLSG